MPRGFVMDPEAWLSDVDIRSLDHESRGWLLDLLCHAWLNDLRVPFDGTQVGNLLRCHPQDWFNSPLHKVIGKWFAFCEGPDGKWWHCTYLEDEAKKVRAWSEKSRQGGRRSGQARLSKAREKATLPPAFPERTASNIVTCCKTCNSMKGGSEVTNGGSNESNHRSEPPFKPDEPPFVHAAIVRETQEMVECDGPLRDRAICVPSPPLHTSPPHPKFNGYSFGGSGREDEGVGEGEEPQGGTQRSLFPELDEVPEVPPAGKRPELRRKASKPSADDLAAATDLVRLYVELCDPVHKSRAGVQNALFWLAAGESYDELAAAVENYAAECRLLGNCGTIYVLAPRNFFGRRDPRFKDYKRANHEPHRTGAGRDPTRVRPGEPPNPNENVIPAWDFERGCPADAPT